MGTYRHPGTIKADQPLPPDILARRNPPIVPRPNQLSRMLAIPPWDVEPPPSARNFFTVTKPLLTAPALGSVATTLASGGAFGVPEKNSCALKLVSIFCDSPTASTLLTYTFRVNGTPVPGLEAAGFAPRIAANIQIDLDNTIQIVDGGFLDCLISNAGAGPFNVSVTLSGWFLPTDDIFRYTGQRPGSIL